MSARNLLVAAVLSQRHAGPRAGYLLLSAHAEGMAGGDNIHLSTRDLLIELILDHLPEVYNRTRRIWPRAHPLRSSR